MARVSAESVLRTRLRELDSDDRSSNSGPSDPRLQHFIWVMGSFTDARMEHECVDPAVLSPELADRMTQGSELLRDIASDEPHLVSGPIQRTMQHWTATGRHGAEPPAADRLHRFYTATATRAGPSMWRTYLNMYYEPYLFPLPWRTWLLEFDPDAPVLEITGAREWTDLVERYPAEGAAGLVGPDWAGAAREYAGVHLTLSGIVAVQGFTFPTRHGPTEPEYWDVESTRWLAPRFNAPGLLEVSTEVPTQW
jgi:hypothetical protein